MIYNSTCRMCGDRYQGSQATTCNPCRLVYLKDYYARNPEMVDKRYRSIERKRQANRSMVNEAKNVPCADCGKSYPPYVMDFDHVRGEKKFAVSNASHKPADVVLEEISKCDVVCSNCHRLRTYNRRMLA